MTLVQCQSIRGHFNSIYTLKYRFRINIYQYLLLSLGSTHLCTEHSIPDAYVVLLVRRINRQIPLTNMPKIPQLSSSIRLPGCVLVKKTANVIREQDETGKPVCHWSSQQRAASLNHHPVVVLTNSWPTTCLVNSQQVPKQNKRDSLCNHMAVKTFGSIFELPHLKLPEMQPGSFFVSRFTKNYFHIFFPWWMRLKEGLDCSWTLGWQTRILILRSFRKDVDSNRKYAHECADRVPFKETGRQHYWLAHDYFNLTRQISR